MQLVATGSTSGTVTYGDTGWRSSCWAIINHTGTAMTASFDDADGDSPLVVRLPAVNTAYVYVYGDFQQMTASGGTIDYMIFA